MDPIEIIHLPIDEWQRYREIRLEALREEPQAFGSAYADMLQKPSSFWQERLSGAAPGGKSWLLFAEECERLVGMIGAFVDPEPDTAEIISVYVSRTARGKGVGKALMAAILAAVSQKKGIRKVTLEVNQRQTAAVALYQRFGFAIVSEKEGLSGDGQIQSGYLMEKLLD